MRRLAVLLALLLVGCAPQRYALLLMPRDSGTEFHGEAVENAGGTEASVTVTIGDRPYSGTWVYTAAPRVLGTVDGGFGWGWRHGALLGTTVAVDNPQGGQAKALLRSADGGGLRCDLTGLQAGYGGGGTCRDDQGLVYDVQIRTKEK
jgi:hypothetical protein